MPEEVVATTQTTEQPPADLRSQLAQTANEIGAEPQQESQTTAATPAIQDPGTSAPPPTPAWREVAGELGFNIPAEADERVVLRQIMQGYSDGRRAHQQLDRVTPYWSEIEQLIASRQQERDKPAPAAKAETGPWWSDFYKEPEFDPAWSTQIVKDLSGNLVPGPGAPPDVVQKYLHYEQHRQKVADDFTRNPYAFMEKGSRHLAREEAKAVMQEMLQERQEQEYINSVVRAPEMDWLWSRNDKGDHVRDMEGHRVLSQWGERHKQHIEKAYQWGWPVQQQQEYALAMTRSEFASSPEYAQIIMQKQNPREAANEKFHQRHERKPNMAGMLPGPADGASPAAATPPPGAPLNLKDMLAKSLKDYTDDDVKDFAVNGHRTAVRQAG